jgi:hypothetical protein
LIYIFVHHIMPYGSDHMANYFSSTPPSPPHSTLSVPPHSDSWPAALVLVTLLFLDESPPTLPVG